MQTSFYSAEIALNPQPVLSLFSLSLLFSRHSRALLALRLLCRLRSSSAALRVCGESVAESISEDVVVVAAALFRQQGCWKANEICTYASSVRRICSSFLALLMSSSACAAERRRRVGLAAGERRALLQRE